ncbi:aminotransferase class III-fold pyridoxal phosphate-dependent enzyme [Pseudomonas aeruginosa]
MKLARKATGRTKVVSFYGAYHGMTAGALAVTGNRTSPWPWAFHRRGVRAPRRSPYGEFDSIGFLERLANDQGSGSEPPAAVIVESVQIQAGVYPASNQWLQRLRKWTTDHGVLLICDEIQAGCGRTRRLLRLRALRGWCRTWITCAKSIGGFRPADGDRVASCRAGCMATGRSHRHLPRQPVGVPDRPHRAQLLAR